MAVPSVPGYRLIAKIKDGGMYSVFKAEKYPYNENNICAVKVLLPKLAKERGILKKVKAEARIALPLKHRYVIDTHRLITDEIERPTLVMEYFPSETLKFIQMKHREELTNDELHRFALQAAEAVGYLHSQGIIHKDIKPENMLISTDRKDFRLIDFSLAETVNKGVLGKLFGGGAKKIEGTITYISPEQIMKKPVSFKSDIYSLGVVFYELLAGKPPFTARDPSALLKAHLSQKPISARTHNPSLAPEVEKLIAQMLEKAPELRPRNMETIGHILSESCKKQGLTVT